MQGKQRNEARFNNYVTPLISIWVMIGLVLRVLIEKWNIPNGKGGVDSGFT